MATDDPAPLDEPDAMGRPRDGDTSENREASSEPPLETTGLDGDHTPLDLGPLFSLNRASAVPRLLADADRIGASLRSMAVQTSAALAPLSGLDVALSSQLAGLHAEWSSSIARATESFRLATAAVPTVAAFTSVFDSPAFSTAVASPALAGLGKTYGSVLSDLERTTGALFRDAALVPPALAAMQETVRAAVEQAQRASLELRAEVLPAVQAAQWWRDDLSAVLSATALESSIDTARMVRSFDRFASAPPVLAELSRLAKAYAPDELGHALASEFPAAVRRASVAPSVEGEGSDAVNAVVAFAVAWVQAATVRVGRALSPVEWMTLVLGIVGLWMNHNARISSSADAQRIVEAVESQTEAIRALGPAKPNAATHVVIELASLHARPEASSTHVGTAYPNQDVRVEATDGAWYRVVFADNVVGHTRAGWMESRAVRATDHGTVHEPRPEMRREGCAE